MAQSTKCEFLKARPLVADERPIVAGDMYYHSGVRWTRVEGDLNLSTGRSVNLIYVIKSQEDEDRSGALVIKTGIQIEDEESLPAKKRKQISLQRSEKALSDNPKCKPSDPIPHGQVSAETYDRYHDADYSPTPDRRPELEKLQRFHTAYVGRRSICKATNDTGWDSLFTFDFRSNRSQYSFDKIVVDGGLFNALVGSVPNALLKAVGRPFFTGGSSKLVEQHVRTIPYHATGGLNCLAITTPSVSVGSFIRINDLERRDLVTIIRSSERRVILSR